MCQGFNRNGKIFSTDQVGWWSRHFNFVDCGHSKIHNGGSSSPGSVDLPYHTRLSFTGSGNLLILDLLIFLIFCLPIYPSSS